MMALKIDVIIAAHSWDARMIDHRGYATEVLFESMELKMSIILLKF